MKNNLKKSWFIILLLVALMSGFTLTSCGGDEKDEPNPTESTIIGTWKWSGIYDYQLLTFRSNGTVTMVEYDTKTNRVKEAIDGTYSQKNEVITIVLDDEVALWSILNLTNSVLTIRYEGEYLGEYLDWDEGTDIMTYIRED